VFWIRIRIGSTFDGLLGLDLDPEGGKTALKKKEKLSLKTRKKIIEINIFYAIIF
jgi:hypothetical protein